MRILFGIGAIVAFAAVFVINKAKEDEPRLQAKMITNEIFAALCSADDDVIRRSNCEHEARRRFELEK